MSAPVDTRAPVALRARLLNSEEDRPIQLVVSADVAADIAFIAEDFAMQVVPNNEQAERLVQVARIVSSRLNDCITARGGESPK